METSNTTPPTLSIRDLRVWFELRRWGFGHVGDVRAVDGISFEIKPGEAAAVVGESGCGKSSLMKTILGLYKPRTGSVYFSGEDIHARGRKSIHAYRANVGYVQQDPFAALPAFMNVQQILEEPLIIAGWHNKANRQDRIRQVMEEVKIHPIEDFLPKYPHMLSGGQQQRIVIARAMILKPQLIIADEPVSMLDASVRVEILRLLRGLQQSHNLSFIYITHDLSTVKYFSEYIFVMYAGKLVEKAPIGRMLKNSSHPYTQALLSATSDPEAKNARVYKEVPPGEPPSLVNPPSGCRFHPRCSKCIHGLCDVQDPPEIHLTPQHQVACWLYSQR